MRDDESTQVETARGGEGEKELGDGPSSPASAHDTNKDEREGSTPEGPTSSPTKKPRTSPRRTSTRVLLKTGCRIVVPRDDEGGCERATVVGVREGGASMVVHDDLMWAGYRTEELSSALQKGEFQYLVEEDDIPARSRVAMLLSPKAGQPPDCFLVGEVPVDHIGWRMFLKLEPAPKTDTFGQRYSQPRIAKLLESGMVVTLSGKVTQLNRNGKCADGLSTASRGTFLGVVDAALTSQHCYWALVQFGEVVHVAALFGKDGEGHVHAVNNADQVSEETLSSMMQAAKVSCRQCTNR